MDCFDVSISSWRIFWVTYLSDDFPSLARMLPRAEVVMDGHGCGAGGAFAVARRIGAPYYHENHEVSVYRSLLAPSSCRRWRCGARGSLLASIIYPVQVRIVQEGRVLAGMLTPRFNFSSLLRFFCGLPDST